MIDNVSQLDSCDDNELSGHESENSSEHEEINSVKKNHTVRLLLTNARSLRPKMRQSYLESTTKRHSTGWSTRSVLTG